MYNAVFKSVFVFMLTFYMFWFITRKTSSVTSFFTVAWRAVYFNPYHTNEINENRGMLLINNE
ncbi:hypothetical protein KQQSB11_370072 [Klebsiella quasipneumoniae subsp. quasipneumoniae]|nr:hypothetical protein KQQSB11_370072 [Klebsiella quasipneumoniae subsp. quasipneumoniae]